MNSITVAIFSFGCIFGGALLGLLFRTLLPDDHLRGEAKDVVKLGAGLIATLAALVLGLLVSSAKSSLDTLDSELVQMSARVITLDRVLANYGSETRPARDMLRGSFAAAIELVWPKAKTVQVQVGATKSAANMEMIQKQLRELSPRNDAQRMLQSQALQIADDLAQSRWLLIQQAQSPLPKVFLIVLLFWLSVLFVCFGMLAPRNATVITVLLVCALSVAGAIFLILEMNSPLTGIIKVSSAPMERALEHLGK